MLKIQTPNSSKRFGPRGERTKLQKAQEIYEQVFYVN